MIRVDLQFFGGRGSSSGSYQGSGQFASGSGGASIGNDMPVAGWTPEAGSASVHYNTTLNSAESRIQNLDHEQLIVIDKNGYVVAVVDGGEHSVTPTARAISAIQNGGVMTHNHPNGGSFSDADVISAGRLGASEIRAVSKSTGKSYSLKAGNKAKGTELAMAMQKDSQKIIDTANSRLNKTVNKRKYANEANYRKAANKVYDEVMGDWLNKNAGKYGYTYTESKTGSAK